MLTTMSEAEKKDQVEFCLHKVGLDGTGKLKKDLLDRPFNHFVSVTDNNQSNIGRAKTLETSLKRDFYLARRMSGSEFKSGPVTLRIVLQ